MVTAISEAQQNPVLPAGHCYIVSIFTSFFQGWSCGAHVTCKHRLDHRNRGRGKGKLPSLQQKLLKEPAREVRRRNTSVGTVKTPVFPELRTGIKGERNTGSEHDELETTAEDACGDTEQASRVWKCSPERNCG